MSFSFPLVELTEPKVSVELPLARIAAFKSELNPFQGQLWMEFWVVYGRLLDPEDPMSFQEWADPRSGERAVYFKLEDAMHPLRPGTALGKCDTCGSWHAKTGGACAAVVCDACGAKGWTAGPCSEDGCEGTMQPCAGTVAPYDGFSRLAGQVDPGGQGCVCETMLKCMTSFLVAEMVPDPDTWEERAILPGVLVEETE